MSKPYMNDAQKVSMDLPKQFWEVSEVEEMEDLLYKKGYLVNIFSRLDHTATRHDAWIVPRDKVGIILEHLFQARITVEVEAEGRYEVALIFVYNTNFEDLKTFFKRLPQWSDKYDYSS